MSDDKLIKRIEDLARENGRLEYRIDQLTSARGELKKELNETKEQLATEKALSVRALEEVVQNKRSGHVDRERLRDCLTSAMRGDKITCIKLIREMTGLGLKESKDLAESAGVWVRY